MINKQEVLIHAKKHNLTPNIIEKDYILNWILYGIANSDILKNEWVFKGGTCLKKCYFEEYRFSEDLDFSILDKGNINTTFLLSAFANISEWIYEHSGIEIPTSELHFETYENPRGMPSTQGRIAYKGPMRRSGSTPTIKLDLTKDELIAEKPTLRKIHHPYSDKRMIEIQVYGIEEIIAEKLRALIERLRPRDLYDVICLHNDNRWHPDKKKVREILEKKCEYKNAPLPSIETLESNGKKSELINDWEEMLTHQIANLDPYEHYWSQLPKVFKWLYEE